MAGAATSAASPWDLSALLNAADPRTGRPERHLWLVRLMQWLRHAPMADDAARATPRAVLRLRLLLKALDQDSAHRVRVQALLQAFWRDVDLASLPASLSSNSSGNRAPRSAVSGVAGSRRCATPPASAAASEVRGASPSDAGSEARSTSRQNACSSACTRARCALS